MQLVPQVSLQVLAQWTSTKQGKTAESNAWLLFHLLYKMGKMLDCIPFIIYKMHGTVE